MASSASGEEGKANRIPSLKILKFSPRINIGHLLTVIMAVVITLVVLYFTLYKPHKPQGTVVSATIHNFTIGHAGFSSYPLLSTSTQFNLNLRNPNKQDIYYQRLAFHLEFPYPGDRVITTRTGLAPMNHEGRSTVEMSPELRGSWRISEAAADALYQPEEVALSLVLNAKLGWKGSLGIKRYCDMFMRCDVSVSYRKGSVLGQVPVDGNHRCQVELD